MELLKILKTTSGSSPRIDLSDITSSSPSQSHATVPLKSQLPHALVLLQKRYAALVTYKNIYATLANPYPLAYKVRTTQKTHKITLSIGIMFLSVHINKFYKKIVKYSACGF
jgi:hypothetical protein